MAPERLYGMDHEHYAWSPMPSRSTLKWPNDARLVLCVIVNLEHLEWEPPADSYRSPNVYSHLAMQRPLVEFWTISHREYGHRIGIFRVLDVLEKHGITPTVAMDAKTATHYPYLVKHCQARGAEIIAHGVAATQMVTSNMKEDEDADTSPGRSKPSAGLLARSPKVGSAPNTASRPARPGSLPRPDSAMFAIGQMTSNPIGSTRRRASYIRCRS